MMKAIHNLIYSGGEFLGSHTTDRFMNTGKEIICLENYFTGRKVKFIQWIGNQRLNPIRHNMTSPTNTEVDWACHIDWPASTIYYQFPPIKTVSKIFLETYNVFRLAKRVGTKLLMARTSLKALTTA